MGAMQHGPERPSSCEGSERRRIAAWSIMALCMIASVTLTQLRSPLFAGVLALGFWGALLAYLVSFAELRRSLWAALPIWGLYCGLVARFTFTWRGHVIEPPLLGTDGQRFVIWANQWLLERRHVGWSLFTFAIHPGEAAGRSIGLEGAGRWVLHAEVALCGALAAVFLFALVRDRGVPRAVAWLSALFFAFALGPWAMATAIDTYIVSVFLFVVFLRELVRCLESAPRVPWVLALVSGIALCISLENVYLPLLFLGLFPFVRRDVRRPWTHALGYAAVTGAVVLAGLAVQRLCAGPPERIPDTIVHHVERFSSLASLVDPGTLLRVAFHETIGSVVAQRSRTIVLYSRGLPGVLDGVTVLYLGLLVALFVAGARSARAGELARSPFAWTLAATLVLRHGFMTAYAPSETILFSAPSIAVLAVLLGCGAAALHGRKLLWYGAAFLALDLLLLLSNGEFLVRAFASARKDFF